MSFARQARGFSLVELVIVVVIVGLLAAIAIPRFSRGAAGAADSAMAGDLAVLRNAIELYAAEHNGVFPTSDDFADQLTKFTKLDGTVSATKTSEFPYGPYMHAVPALKVGGNAGLTAVEAVSETPSAANGTSAGWLYNPTTGQIWANDTEHIAR